MLIIFNYFLICGGNTYLIPKEMKEYRKWEEEFLLGYRKYEFFEILLFLSARVNRHLIPNKIKLN